MAIASTEFLEMTALAEVFRASRSKAPGIVFQFRNVHGKLPKLRLEQGTLDIAIAGYFGDLPEGFYQQKLFDNDFVVVARKKHPRIRSVLTLATFVDLEHLLISPQGDLWGLLDDQLLHLKKSRRVVGGFENYLTPGWYVSQSDCIASVPRYLGEFYRRIFPVELHELPVHSPRITVVQAWHERTNNSPLHRFVRASIAESAAELV